MIEWLKINGVTMPAPRSFQILRADIDSDKTGRSETGRLKRDRVRADTRKFNFEWILNEEQLSFLLSYLSLEKFTARVWDGSVGGYAQYTMYAGDRTCNIVKWDPDDPSKNLWEVSCNIIEY